MPNIKSAKKRVKVTKVKTARNKAYKSELKTVIKKALLSVENSSEDRNESVRNAIKYIDRASSKGIIHKNVAARKKSTLTRKLNSVNAG